VKKLSAILLILLFLCNLFGYRIYFYYAQQQSDINLEANLDKNIYNESELISLTIPFQMPYLHNSDGFERFDGEVTFNGKIYKYVKRKFSDGNMTFLCLPNHNKMHLEAAKNNITSNLNDLQGSGKKTGNSKSTLGKNQAAEYINQIAHCTISFNSTIKNYYLLNNPAALSAGLRTSPEQPPERA
jgi:hypothetical protein